MMQAVHTSQNDPMSDVPLAAFITVRTYMCTLRAKYHCNWCVCVPLPPPPPLRRPVLPDYYLDFGYVVYGHVLRKTVFLTNAGDLPCTVAVGRRVLAGTGYSVDLTDKIKALPEGERVEFVVTFDPASAHCPTEETVAVLPLQVTGGPCYHLRLRSVVTLPDVELSSMEVDFETVLCGQCKIVTLRMRNNKHVQ